MAHSASSCSSEQSSIVFRPTLEEMKNFTKYIEKIENVTFPNVGFAKVIPPEGWCPRKDGYCNLDNIIISTLYQRKLEWNGYYTLLKIPQHQKTLIEFKRTAVESSLSSKNIRTYYHLKEEHWTPPIDEIVDSLYGGLSGSFFDEDLQEFNLQRLNTKLDLLKEDFNLEIDGVNTPYLNFGEPGTTQGLDTEVMDLYGIHYLHFGKPKIWHIIRPDYGMIVRFIAERDFQNESSQCEAFLRHRTLTMCSCVLEKANIPYKEITQVPGEFIITYPYAYHQNFDLGFNCSEKINFALPRWVEYGKRASVCKCGEGGVSFPMHGFVQDLQYHKYSRWMKGFDFGRHPEGSSFTRLPKPGVCPFPLKERRDPVAELMETLATIVHTVVERPQSTGTETALLSKKKRKAKAGLKRKRS